MCRVSQAQLWPELSLLNAPLSVSFSMNTGSLGNGQSPLKGWVAKREGGLCPPPARMNQWGRCAPSGWMCNDGCNIRAWHVHRGISSGPGRHQGEQTSEASVPSVLEDITDRGHPHPQQNWAQGFSSNSLCLTRALNRKDRVPRELRPKEQSFQSGPCFFT